MANRTYRLNNLIKNSIHRPYIKGDKGPLILYKKVEGYRGEEDNIAKGYSEDSKYQKYVSTSEKNYNSPRNIRRLFILGDRAVVQYYHSPYVNGNEGGTNWSESNYFSESVDDILNKAVEYDNYDRSSGGKEPDRVIIVGNPFKAVVDPLMCSNIAEIYIDNRVAEAMYRSNDIMQEVCNNSNLGADKIKRILTSIINSSNIVCTSGEDSKLPFDMVKAGVGNKMEQLTLLSTVGIISNLKSILEDNRMNKDGEFVKNISTEDNIWWKDNVELIKEYGGTVVIGSRKIEDRTSISCSPNIYEYDRQILSGVFERYISTYESLMREQKYGRANESSAVNIEEVIRKLEEKHGKLEAAHIVMLAASELSETDISNVISTFSIGELRTRYSKLLKVKE